MKACLLLRFEEAPPHHQLGTRSIHPGGARGEREELEREEDHRVTALPLATTGTVISEESGSRPRTRTLALLLLTVLPSGLQGVRVPRTLYLPSSTASASLGQSIGTIVPRATATASFTALAAALLVSPSSGSVSPPLIGWSVCLFRQVMWQVTTSPLLVL